MCQHNYDNAEEEFMSEYTPEEEAHMAAANIVQTRIIESFEDDATEIMFILAENIRQIALGNRDGECLISIIDAVFNAPFNQRYSPINRLIMDAIYIEALAIAELDL